MNHNRRPSVWRHVGERFSDVNIVNRVPHGGSGVMVWAGINYGQWTLLHFIDGNLNAQRYRDEIPRPIVVPFIRRHHLMFQHDNTQPHVGRICTQILKDENLPVLPWPASSHIKHVWDALDRCVFQFPPISSNFTQPLKRSGTSFYRPQSTAWSTLCKGDVSRGKWWSLVLWSTPLL